MWWRRRKSGYVRQNWNLSNSAREACYCDEVKIIGGVDSCSCPMEKPNLWNTVVFQASKYSGRSWSIFHAAGNSGEGFHAHTWKALMRYIRVMQWMKTIISLSTAPLRHSSVSGRSEKLIHRAIDFFSSIICFVWLEFALGIERKLVVIWCFYKMSVWHCAVCFSSFISFCQHT